MMKSAEHSMVLPDEHMVLLYSEETETIDILVNFIKSNLENNFRCAYIIGDINTQTLLNELKSKVELEDYIAKNQFTLIDKDDSYSKGGIFDPDLMVQLLIDESKRAKEDSYDGFALTGELSWVLAYEDGFDKIMEYEWKLNDTIFSKHPVSSICRYNMNKFSDEMILNIIQVHPYIIWKNQVHDNPFYIPADGFKLNETAKYQVDTWLENISLFTKSKSELKLKMNKIENELLESEEEYKYIFNNSPVGKSITGTDGPVKVNNAFCKMLGYTKAELEGQTWEKLTHPDDIDISRKTVSSLLEGINTTVRFNKRYIRKDGSVLWADVHTSIRRDTIGQPMYFMTNIIDVSSQKAAEEEMIRANELFKFLYENAPLPYQSLDKNGRFITINNAWLDLFGYDREEVDGKWFGDFIQPEIINEWSNNFSKFKSNGSISTEFDMPKKNGEKIKVHIDGRVRYGNDGSFKQTHCIIRDVTAQLKFTDILKKKEEELRLLLEKLQVGIVVHSEDSSILFSNSMACNILGVSSETMVSKKAADEIWSFTDVDGNLLTTDKYPVSIVLKSKSILENYEMGIVSNSSKDIRWLIVNGFPILRKNGHIDRVVISFVDVTEEKEKEKSRIELESQLRSQQKLESIGTLASGVAHEINNPLNGIMNYGQIILDSDPNDASIKEYAKEIVHETNRIAEIVRNLLNFSRRNGKEHSYANIEDIISQTTSLVNTVINRDQIDLRVNIEENLPQIKCRSQQIQQVIMNLLTNAQDALNEKHKAYDEDKIINLRCSQFKRDNRLWLEIVVEDYGPGIPDDIVNKIYDPFFTTKGRDKGTGLGLYISYGIIKEHHGSMEVETEKDKYTRFIINLPCDNGWDLNG